MKLVVFAHIPPPHHGQSYMVKLMLKALETRASNENKSVPRLEVFHVNAQLSRDMEVIGSFEWLKLFLLLRYCLTAFWYRFAQRADVFYYIPAPGSRAAIYRDWIVMFLCRPVFRKIILHWHATGLGRWLERDAFPWERWITRRLLNFPDLSIALSTSLSEDAAYFRSKRVCVLPNGIPDPCPDFETSVFPRRNTRLAGRRAIIEKRISSGGDQERYEVIFLAHCAREKGLFDTLSAIELANQHLAAEALSLRMHLTVAGSFVRESERKEFDLWLKAHPDEVDYVAFVRGEAKTKLLREGDCFCFPTYYSAEGQPVSIIEAMAFGLTILATAWRGIPELLPGNYPFLIPQRDPAAIARSLIESMTADPARELRSHYCETFTEERYGEKITEALRLVGAPTN